jgi:hypothetical protein
MDCNVLDQGSALDKSMSLAGTRERSPFFRVAELLSDSDDDASRRKPDMRSKTRSSSSNQIFVNQDFIATNPQTVPPRWQLYCVTDRHVGDK